VVVGAGGNILGCRYLGGGGTDVAYGVAIDTADRVYVTGGTNSGGLGKFPVFPTTGSAFRNYLKGDTDAFITRLNNVGENIVYSTYLGGTKIDVGTAIDVDSNFYPYITGYTSSSDPNPNNLFPIFPTNVFQPTFGGGTASGPWDAFITKMKPDLSAMNYSTFLGGLYDEKAYGIAVDSNGTAFVTGYTNSENFPITFNCTTQPVKGEGFLVPDAFITQMNQNGTGLLFSTYLGGTYYDEGSAIAITDDGLNITVTGYTESINFPVVNAYQPNLAGFPAVRFTDAFVTKIVKVPPVANFTSIPYPATGCTPLTVYFTDTSTNNPTSWFWDFGDNSTDNTSTEQNPNHTYVNPKVNAAMNFTVNLTACNCDGCNTTSMINFTRVCPQPFADFNATNTTGCLNLGNNTIQFNVTYIKGGVKIGPAKVWNWSWGDGTYNLTNFSLVNFTHTYTTVGNFTVSLTYENSCCNNTTTKVEYIDIRDEPVADFYAIPTSGLIPLDVQFFDNSSGRPSSWYWMFGAQQGTSTEQNPEHTYSTKGAYTVRLQACNFCGCDWQNNTSYIKAGVPNLTFSPGILVVPTNDTTPITLKLQVAEYGLSGYDLNVFWDDSVHGDITAVQFPPWATNTSYTPLPNYFVQIQAVDLINQVNPGAMNITLATFNLTGNISTFQSTINFNVTPNQLDDDDGNPIFTNTIPANITVVRLLPFPGKTLPPTDPDGNQLYWDVNGNGNIDFDDVVTYFQNMQWIRDNQYRPFFNYNGNLEVAPNYGIDFADLIMLFNKV
jgi:PKD repeat protein